MDSYLPLSQVETSYASFESRWVVIRGDVPQTHTDSHKARCLMLSSGVHICAPRQRQEPTEARDASHPSLCEALYISDMNEH